MSTPSRRKCCAPNPTAQPRDWTHSLAWRTLRDRTTGSGGMPTLCVLGCLAMARYRRYAFPSARRWRDMREMRSRATGSGKISPRCVPGRQSVAIFSLHASRKWPRTRKRGLRGKIRAPCIRNELALAGYARHASEKPRKQPFGNAPREDLARKGPFSLHGPLESRTARESCHRSAHERKGSGRKCLRFVKN